MREKRVRLECIHVFFVCVSMLHTVNTGKNCSGNLFVPHLCNRLILKEIEVLNIVSILDFVLVSGCTYSTTVSIMVNQKKDTSGSAILLLTVCMTAVSSKCVITR